MDVKDAERGTRRAPHARCPRCGYDLRGEMESWRERCPLHGRCPECGVALEWPEMLAPHKFEPRWCVEFVKSRRGTLFAAHKTFIRCWRPWRFWSRLRMPYPIRRARLAAHVAILMAPLILLYSVEQAMVAVRAKNQLWTNLKQSQAAAPAMLATFRRIVQNGKDDPSIRGLTPQRQDEYLQMAKDQVDQLQMMIRSPLVIHDSYALAAFETIFFPASDSSWGRYSLGGHSNPMPGPALMFETAWADAYPYHQRFFVEVRRAAAWAGARFALVAILPLAFILLPVSMRRAKVRWIHVWRIAAYSVFIPVANAWLQVGLFAIGVLMHDWGYRIGTRMEEVNRLGTPLALMIWWWAALGRYLRMPHAFAVAVCLTLICELLVAVCLWWTSNPIW